MKHAIIISCFIFSMLAANAQDQKSNLAYHFQQRLAAPAGTPAPTYAEMFQLTDGIASSGVQDIISALPDLTVPLMINHLIDPGKPSFAKVDLVSTLLDFRRSDPAAMRAVERFVELVVEPRIRIATRMVLGRHRVDSPKLSDFCIRSLGDTNKHVQITAISSVNSLGTDVLGRARLVLSKMAVDPAEDAEVRSLADKALRNDLMKPERQ